MSLWLVLSSWAIYEDLSSIWQIALLLNKFLLLEKAKNLSNYLAIWSHCYECRRKVGTLAKWILSWTVTILRSWLQIPALYTRFKFLLILQFETEHSANISIIYLFHICSISNLSSPKSCVKFKFAFTETTKDADKMLT